MVRWAPVAVIAGTFLLIAAVAWGRQETGLASVAVPVLAPAVTVLFVIWLFAWLLADRRTKFSWPAVLFIWLMVFCGAGWLFSRLSVLGMAPSTARYVAPVLMLFVVAVGIFLAGMRARVVGGGTDDDSGQ